MAAYVWAKSNFRQPPTSTGQASLVEVLGTCKGHVHRRGKNESLLSRDGGLRIAWSRFLVSQRLSCPHYYAWDTTAVLTFQKVKVKNVRPNAKAGSFVSSLSCWGVPNMTSEWLQRCNSSVGARPEFVAIPAFGYVQLLVASKPTPSTTVQAYWTLWSEQASNFCLETNLFDWVDQPGSLNVHRHTR